MMMRTLVHEYNSRKQGSALKMPAEQAKDMMNTIKDFRHTLELLIIEIPKAKAEFSRGLFAMLENIKNNEAFSGKFMTEMVRFQHKVKIIVCRNDLPRPGEFYGDDREAFMDINRMTWEWVPHRLIREQYNAVNPLNTVIIDADDYDGEGWYIDRTDKQDYGKWFRGRTVMKQIERLANERMACLLNNARRLIQLRQKYTRLNIATWVFRKLKGFPETIEETKEEEETEQVELTMEESEMVEMLRCIDKQRSNKRFEMHRRAQAMLKRKREKEEEDAQYNHNKRSCSTAF